MDDVVATRLWFHYFGFRPELLSTQRSSFVSRDDIHSFPDARVALGDDLVVVQLRREWHESRFVFQRLNLDELPGIHGGVHQFGH